MHDPQTLAELAGKTMYERDPTSQALGMALSEIRPGYARMTMTVRADMLNGHRTCHGGYIFMLADSAFAFACNSHNFNTVGAGCTIDYLAPGREGDVLTAEAVEQALIGKTGVYDIAVTIGEGRTVALFRGKSHRVPGMLVELNGES
jgi:acyl-CoA thioesterase